MSRNTVVAVYQELIADGYIVSRQRSGIFVGDTLPEGKPSARVVDDADKTAELLVWRNRIKHERISESEAHDLPNWSNYPFPFIDGKFDASLFPLAEWREASKLALSVAAVEEWSTGSVDADDAMLVHEIRTKFLTRRGIQAGPDEVLVTLGTQNSLYLISQLLADRTTTVGIEEPGNFRLRRLLEDRDARIRPQRVDEKGLRVDRGLAGCDWVYVTPSHQVPTAVAMPSKRRQALVRVAAKHDFLIVEDDYECELNYDSKPEPAIHSMDKDGRVIYVAELARYLHPGLRLGFIVANAALIRQARNLRRTLSSSPPLNNQRVAAYFLSLGYCRCHKDDASQWQGAAQPSPRVARCVDVQYARCAARDSSPEVGGTTYWVKAPKQFNVDYFVQEAAQHGGCCSNQLRSTTATRKAPRIQLPHGCNQHPAGPDRAWRETTCRGADSPSCSRSGRTPRLGCRCPGCAARP